MFLRERMMRSEIFEATEWLVVGAAAGTAIIVAGQTYPLLFLLIPVLY